MPYAQSHYPFENKDTFASGFPADFCAEGLDQTRGWFYTLFVLSTHLFNQPPFRNLIVNGLVLARYHSEKEPSLLIMAVMFSRWLVGGAAFSSIFIPPLFIIYVGLCVMDVFSDGKKMSKRLRNFPPPENIINQYGADALR